MNAKVVLTPPNAFLMLRDPCCTLRSAGASRLPAAKNNVKVETAVVTSNKINCAAETLNAPTNIVISTI